MCYALNVWSIWPPFLGGLGWHVDFLSLPVTTAVGDVRQSLLGISAFQVAAPRCSQNRLTVVGDSHFFRSGHKSWNLCVEHCTNKGYIAGERSCQSKLCKASVWAGYLSI